VRNYAALPTTSANSLLEPIHGRMPVIVSREDWEEWFSPGELADRSFQRIIAPYRAEEMTSLAVSPLVNSARVDDPRCCLPGDSVMVEPPKLEITRQQPRTDQQTLGFDRSPGRKLAREAADDLQWWLSWPTATREG